MLKEKFKKMKYRYNNEEKIMFNFMLLQRSENKQAEDGIIICEFIEIFLILYSVENENIILGAF